MRTPLAALLALVVLAVALFGGAACGGGGGTGSSGSSGGSFSLTPSTITSGPNGEHYLVARQGSAMVDVTWSSQTGVVTPIAVGLALYTAPPNGTDVITATTVATPTRQDSTSVTVNAALATVRGRVVSDQGGGISGIIVDFYAGNTLVGSTTTLLGGYFSSGVNATATRFHLRNSTIPGGFYRAYTYDGQRFTTLGTPVCSAPLPPISAGASVQLAGDVTVPAAVGPPPPPPNGCP